FRPFPADQVRSVLAGADHVIVLERAFAPGAGGVLSADVRAALAGTATRITTVVAGLGGRAITKAGLQQVVRDAGDGTLDGLTFLDLDTEAVEQELVRHREV